MGEPITEKLNGIRELPSSLKASAASVTGTRDHQEDCLMYQVLEDGVLGVVCDGMGGLAGGEKASACAVDQLSEYFASVARKDMPGRAYWESALRQLDEQVAGLTDAKGKPLGGGTTLVAVFIRDDRMTYASAGDSMLYLLRKGTCTQLVRLHNYRLILERQLQQGQISLEEFMEEQDSGEALITYLGMNGFKVWDCSLEPLRLEDGDRIILCSDGLYRALPQEQIQAIAESCDEAAFEKTALELVRAVFKGPPRSLDNISILCFLFKAEDPAAQGTP